MTVDDKPDIMLAEVMADAVRNGVFIDYDGFGEYLDEDKNPVGETFTPSTFEVNKAPFVQWYNR